MKHFSLATIVVALFAPSFAFAATSVAEPSLPADIENYIEDRDPPCTKHAGKTLEALEYLQNTENLLRRIAVISLNGEKVSQLEIDQTDFSPGVERGPDKRKIVRYVRNSPEKNWLRYELTREWRASQEHYLAEIGLTQKEIDEACGP